jgi:predicted ATPase
VVLSGDAGIGKTRLMIHFTDRIEHTGFRVLGTGCVELGAAGLPLVPLQTALRQLVDQLGVETLRQTQAGIDALLRLLPEFGALAPGPDDPTRLYDRFGALLAHLGAEHPLLWLIDDLHCADGSTRELLGFLARTLRACRVLVVTAYRADDLDRGHPLRPVLVELPRLNGLRCTVRRGAGRRWLAGCRRGGKPSGSPTRRRIRSCARPRWLPHPGQVRGRQPR